MNNDQYTVTVSQQDSDGDLKAILVSSRMSLAALRTYLGPSISIPADFFLAKVSNL